MIMMSSNPEPNPVQVFRVEPERSRSRSWSVVQSGSPVASFRSRDEAVEAAHTLASSAWRLRQCVARVVVLGEDGRPQSFRMYGDPSVAPARQASQDDEIVLHA